MRLLERRDGYVREWLADSWDNVFTVDNKSS
jgi:hypothetical protein